MSLKEQKKLVLLYFEKIFWWHFPVVFIARVMRWKIFVFDTDLKLKQRRVLRILLEKGWLERVVAHHYSFGTSHSQALEYADCIINSMHGHTAIKNMTRIYADDEVMLVFKKSLAEKLAVLTSMQTYFQMNCMTSIVWFIPGHYCALMHLLRHRGIAFDFPEGVRVIGKGSGARLVSFLSGLKIWLFIVCGYLMYFLVRLFRKPNIAKKKFKFAVSLSAPWFEKFKGGPREFTFLIDGDALHKSDVAFLVEYPNSESFYSLYRKRGYHLFPAMLMRNLRQFFEPNVLNASDELKYLPSLLLCSWRTSFIREAVVNLLITRLNWGGTLARVHFDHYVYCNKEGNNQVAANIFFRSQGVVSWSYSQFVGGPYQVVGPNTAFDDKNVYWSFLNSDYFLLNCRAMLESMQQHHQKVRHYEVVGNIFSEMIVNINKQEARKKILGDNEAGIDTKWVAIFDTSYVDMELSYSNFYEAAAFLSDFIKLAENRTDLLFIFKPSKSDDYFIDAKTVWASLRKGADIVKLRKEIASLSNVTMLSDANDPVEVIAAADVVVTHCFSSPTADALSAGIPAFWYESASLTRGYPLDEVDGLVAHGYMELNSFLDRAFFAGKYLKSLYKQELFQKLVNVSVETTALSDLRRALSEANSI